MRKRKAWFLILAMVTAGGLLRAEDAAPKETAVQEVQAEEMESAEDPDKAALPKEEKKAPEAAPAAAEAKPAAATPAASPAPAAESKPAVPAAVPAQEAKAEKAPEPKKQEAAGCASAFKDLITYHEREIISLKKNMERWNARMKTSLERQAELESEISALGKEIERKQGEEGKKNKAEAGRMRKQAERLTKDLGKLKEESREQCLELAKEIKDMGRDAQASQKEVYQQSSQGIAESLKH